MGAEIMSEKMPWRKEFANDWPCSRDCPDRHMGCHSDCKEYLKAKEKNDIKKQTARSKRLAECEVNEYIVRRVSETARKPIKSR